MQSTEYRECKGRESRGGSTVHDESTVREYRVRVQSRECRECENAEARVQRVRECRVESRESARAQSREEGAQCTMTESRVREFRVQSAESARMQSRECRERENAETRGGSTVHDEITV